MVDNNIIQLAIYDKFVLLCNKYYKPGNYVIDIEPQYYIPGDKFVKTITCCNSDINYDFPILEHIIDINPFNINNMHYMKKIIWKPFIKIPKSEFEELFAFGIAGKYYDANKQILVCPKSKIYSFDEVKTAMLNTPFSDTYIQQVKDLMLYGGYINDKAALQEMELFSRNF